MIHQSQTLREQIAYQQRAILHQLDVADDARTALLATRERCGDSLRALRASLDATRTRLGSHPPGLSA
jgi:hypothetical protein